MSWHLRSAPVRALARLAVSLWHAINRRIESRHAARANIQAFSGISKLCDNVTLRRDACEHRPALRRQSGEDEETANNISRSHNANDVLAQHRWAVWISLIFTSITVNSALCIPEAMSSANPGTLHSRYCQCALMHINDYYSVYRSQTICPIQWLE